MSRLAELIALYPMLGDVAADLRDAMEYQVATLTVLAGALSLTNGKPARAFPLCLAAISVRSRRLATAGAIETVANFRSWCWELPFVVSLSNRMASTTKGLRQAQAERTEQLGQHFRLHHQLTEGRQVGDANDMMLGSANTAWRALFNQ
jgi:hypothetical protein